MHKLFTFVASNFDKIDISPLPHASNTGTEAQIQAGLTIVFGLIGALSVLFLSIGGFRYVASQGDPQAAARAKGTIIYSVVGLVVSITAVSIVTFVLGKL